MNNVNISVGNTSVGEEEYTLYGKSSITETLRGLTFQISANSFFQTNTYQVCNISKKIAFLFRSCPLFYLLSLIMAISQENKQIFSLLGRGFI